LLPFRRGFERIMKDVDAPIIPVCLDGVWGSIFSSSGAVPLETPRLPVPRHGQLRQTDAATATAIEVRTVIQELAARPPHRRKT
jgi:acyl-[acyl-carrier-protein]-phospholipid O-acyltransferase/long-chain-fatty-acid--[acyl-carrier-protein] ligase